MSVMSYVELGEQRAGLLADFFRSVKEGDLVRFGLMEPGSNQPCFLYSHENGFIVSDEEDDRCLRRVTSVTGYLVSHVSSPRVLLDFPGASGGRAEMNEFWSLSPFDVSSRRDIDSVGAVRVPVRLIQKYDILSDVAANPGELLRSYLNGSFPHNFGQRPPEAHGFELRGFRDD